MGNTLNTSTEGDPQTVNNTPTDDTDSTSNNSNKVETTKTENDSDNSTKESTSSNESTDESTHSQNESENELGENGIKALQAERKAHKELKAKLVDMENDHKAVVADLQSKLQAAESRNAAINALVEADLPTDLVEFITATDDDGIATQVTKLASLQPNSGQSNSTLLGTKYTTGGVKPSTGELVANSLKQHLNL